MGYDITVKRTNFHRWFSVWNWHRCVASAIYGLGGLDDEEYRNELYAVNDLQQNGLPKDDNGEVVSMADIDTKIETGTNVEKTVIQVDVQYDDELRAIGAAALIPVPAKVADSKDFNPEEFAEMIAGTINIQVRTNNLLHDHKEMMQFTDKDCQLLSSMDGEEIRREAPMMLAIGLGSCLEKLGLDGQKGSMREVWTNLLDELEMPEPIRTSMFEPIFQLFDESAKHEVSFEIAEYLEMESLAAFASAIAIMGDAMFSNSTIMIN
mgnify:CR=1 FL=1|jgi:hypothetical protein